MMMFKVFASLATLVATVVAQPNPGTVSGYTSVHDPAVCKVNGVYYTYSTGVGLPVLTSTDRTAWTLAGKVWPNGASWTDAYTGASNANLWAPKCVYANNQFYLYYAASSFGSQKSAIFLATSSSGKPGTFTHQGLVIESSAGLPYNAIDPDIFIENGKWTFTWGSWWQGIYSTSNVNPSTGKLTSTSGYIQLANRSGKGIEAPTIFKNGTYYYLFSSWDNCCQGTSSTYNIRYGRSTSVSGPYVDKAGVALTNGGGTLLLGTHGGIYGPGHQDVIRDSDQVCLFYHYYTSSGSYLGINWLTFASGWPVLF